MNPIRLTFSTGYFPELFSPYLLWYVEVHFISFFPYFVLRTHKFTARCLLFWKILSHYPSWLSLVSLPFLALLTGLVIAISGPVIYWLSWRNEVVVLRGLSPNLFSYQRFSVEFPQIHEDPSWFSSTRRGQPVQHRFGFCTECQESVMCRLWYSSRSFVCLVGFATGDLSVDQTSSLLQELWFMEELQVLQVMLKVFYLTDRPTSFGGTGWVSSVLHQQNKAQRKWTSWERRLWQKTRWGWPGPTGLDNRKLGENLDKSNSVGSVSNGRVSFLLETAGSGARL